MPLSRPIFIYAKKTSLDRAEVREFARFQLNPDTAPKLIEQTGYIPFPPQYYQQALDRLNAVQTGTVFPGGSQVGVKLDDLFEPDTVNAVVAHPSAGRPRPHRLGIPGERLPRRRKTR